MPPKRKSLDESAREFFQSSVTSQKEVANSAAEFVNIESIRLPSQQPRRYFDPEKLQSLVQSISAQGILEPLLVRPLGNHQYELVAGERRYRAAQIASLTEVPVVIRQLSDTEALQLALTENLQREDLNPVEETEGILQLLALKLESDREGVISLLDRLINTERGVTNNVVSNDEQQIIEEVFASVGKLSVKSFRMHRLPLLNLPEDILSALRSGQIEYTKAKAIATLKDEAARAEILEEAIANSLSLSQIKERVSAAKPIKEKEELKSRVDTTYKQLKKSKQLWQDPKKRKKLESLLSQLEKLIESESSSMTKANERPIVKTSDSQPESLEQIEEESATEADGAYKPPNRIRGTAPHEKGLSDQELGKLLGVSNLLIRDCREKGKKPPAGLVKKLQDWEVKGDRWVRKS